MPVNFLKKLFLPGAACCLLLGCQKNYTKYYGDNETPGIAIFSNTGNDILSCLIGGKPWRTVSREFTGGAAYSHTDYEMEIRKVSTNPLKDTLVIRWHGYFQSNPAITNYLTLHLAVPINFGAKDFSALQGQRLSLDSTVNGFFSNDVADFFYSSGPKGNGSIYFLTASLDSTGPATYSGKMSGVFEANFSTSKITSGRFDHELVSGQVRF